MTLGEVAPLGVAPMKQPGEVGVNAAEDLAEDLAGEAGRQQTALEDTSPRYVES